MNIIWGPHYSGDKHKIDRVQHSATRLVLLVPGFDEISYEEQLCRLRSPSLMYIRKRGDMIQTYKIMRRFDRIDPAPIPAPKSAVTLFMPDPAYANKH